MIPDEDKEVNSADAFMVEYSASQNRFHIHTVREAMEQNLSMLLRGEKSDWVIVAPLAGDREQANRYLGMITPVINQIIVHHNIKDIFKKEK